MTRRVEFTVLPRFYVFFSFMLLLLPLPWLLAALCAGIVHELGHYLAIRAFRIPVYGVSLQGAGARIRTGEMSRLQEVICSSAGPFFGGLLFLLFPIVPRIAVCGLLQTAYNLLPFPNFDGGRILRSLLSHFLSENRAKGIQSLICRGFLVISGIVLCHFNLLVGLTVLATFLQSIGKRLTNISGVLN